MKLKALAVTSIALLGAFAVFPAKSQAAPGFKILHSFAGSDGDRPTSLLQTKDGTIWGVTLTGGTAGLGNGVLYRIDRNGTYTVVHTFTDTPDGSLPGKLIEARDGTIYGLTLSGGAKFGGTVYRVDRSGTYSVIHSFDPSTEGSGPSFLLQAANGMFYGTASGDGNPNAGCAHPPQGVFFRMTASGKVTPLHAFCEEVDGSQPNSVVEASDGFFYGTCREDGPFGGAFGNGTLWKADVTGQVTLLHVFGPNTLNGAEPTEPLGVVQAADGRFYGVSNGGGQASNGAIFRADTSGNIETVYSFNDFATTGSDPEDNFILGNDGFFYGTASDGGLPVDTFLRTGVVYRADTSGHVWVLHTFLSDDGDRPGASPFLDRRAKTVYATAQFQGPMNHGVTTSIALKSNLPIVGLGFSVNPVKGGLPSSATLTLAQPAGLGGQVVKLFGTGAVNLPASVTVPSGQTSVTFTVNTTPVSISYDATVTAYIANIGLSAPLTLIP